MEKQILTELLGADFAAKITEDADVKAIIEDAKKSLKDKYFEAFKNDPEYNDGIKSSSKAMGIAEASMKAKKKIAAFSTWMAKNFLSMPAKLPMLV